MCLFRCLCAVVKYGRNTIKQAKKDIEAVRREVQGPGEGGGSACCTKNFFSGAGQKSGGHFKKWRAMILRRAVEVA